MGPEPADCLIGLETAHNLFIDYLWSQAYSQVYVLPPNQVKSNQGLSAKAEPMMTRRMPG